MAKRKRRSFGKILRGAVKDVVMPTSMGLGIAIGGCGGSSGKADGPILAVMPPADAVADHRADYAIMPPAKDAAADYRADYAIMPPVEDAARADTGGPEVPVYAIMPPIRDAGPDSRDARPDVPIYAIMPFRPESPDLGPWDTASDRQDATPDTTKPPKEVGPIFAIMPLAVLPPRG